MSYRCTIDSCELSVKCGGKFIDQTHTHTFSQCNALFAFNCVLISFFIPQSVDSALIYLGPNRKIIISAQVFDQQIHKSLRFTPQMDIIKSIRILIFFFLLILLTMLGSITNQLLILRRLLDSPRCCLLFILGMICR